MPKRQRRLGMRMQPSRTELGTYIREHRLALGLSQAELTEQCGFHKIKISTIETGVTKYPEDDELARIATALKCNVEELRSRIPVKPEKPTTTDLGRFIRARREELGMSISDFADRMKLETQRVRHLERFAKFIRRGTARKLAKVLELDITVLFKFVETARTNACCGLGQLVRTRRRNLGMSLAEIAKRIGVKRQFVHQIELGKTFLNTKHRTAARLARILGLDLSELEILRPERKLKKPSVVNTNALGLFLANRRLELHLTQHQVGVRVQISTTTICGYETGRLRLSLKTRGRLEAALNCRIPSELIEPTSVQLSDQSAEDLTPINGLSTLKGNQEIGESLLSITRRILAR